MIKHKIGLRGMEFFAFHGLHPEEKINGNQFIVDVEVETDFTAAAQTDEVSGTFDYEIIHGIVSREMNISSKMLEHLAERIMVRIKATPGTLYSVWIRIQKLNPPLPGKTAASYVEISFLP